uniref:Uncharacterized protein n=1 Tax=Physcomitrium patens TaxID=3218 RepID=A0A2K1J039_PHYPA|nr:hypothetical protein PHYPA_022795 [Physcomitrium patens]
MDQLTMLRFGTILFFFFFFFLLASQLNWHFSLHRLVNLDFHHTLLQLSHLESPQLRVERQPGSSACVTPLPQLSFMINHESFAVNQHSLSLSLSRSTLSPTAYRLPIMEGAVTTVAEKRTQTERRRMKPISCKQ